MKQISSQSKRLYLLMTILPYGLYALSSLGLSYLYTYCASDVILSGTLLPILLDILIALIQTLIIPAVAWALISVAALTDPTAPTKTRLLIIYLCSLLFCRLADLAMAWILGGSLGLASDILFAVWYLVFDLILAGVLFWVVCRKERPLLHTLLRLSILLGAVRVGQRILYDIVYCVDAASLPALSEIPVMIAYYLGDLLLALGFFALSLWIGRTLLRHEKKASAPKCTCQ